MFGFIVFLPVFAFVWRSRVFGAGWEFDQIQPCSGGDDSVVMMKIERYCSMPTPRAEIRNSIMWPSPSRPCEALSVGKQSLASTGAIVFCWSIHWTRLRGEDKDKRYIVLPPRHHTRHWRHYSALRSVVSPLLHVDIGKPKSSNASSPLIIWSLFGYLEISIFYGYTSRGFAGCTLNSQNN